MGDKGEIMKRTTLFISLVIICLTNFAIVFAQTTDFKVGQRVEYKDQRWPKEIWKEGTVVRVDAQSHQVIVHWDPRDDYPSYTKNGVSIYEQAYNLDDVRPIQPKTGNQTADKNGDTTAPPANSPKTPKANPPAAGNGGGTGLMSKQEILDYMKTHGYVNGQPKYDQQVCRDLIEIMKKRGVQDALRAGTDDLTPINANGCAGAEETDVTKASMLNQGVPPTMNWLAGTWTLTVFGDTVYSAPGDGYIYKQGPKTGTQGALTINTNGTYMWNDGKGQVLKGSWRNATAEEMDLQGGAGIVLQRAAQGRDWIVFKYQSRVPNKTERVEVEDLQNRGPSRWMGWRR